MIDPIEAAARAMDKRDRTAYLQRRGWRRVSARDVGTWFSPGWQQRSDGLLEPPNDDRCFYSLAAAIRTALANDPRYR